MVTRNRLMPSPAELEDLSARAPVGLEVAVRNETLRMLASFLRSAPEPAHQHGGGPPGTSACGAGRDDSHPLASIAQSHRLRISPMAVAITRST
jgi:hypothetical protein